MLGEKMGFACKVLKFETCEGCLVVEKKVAVWGSN